MIHEVTAVETLRAGDQVQLFVDEVILTLSQPCFENLVKP